LNVPVTVGVPEISPFVVFTLRPAGNGDVPQVVITWSAVIWYENGIPIVPLAVVGLVIFGFGAATALSAAPKSVTINSAAQSAKIRIGQTHFKLEPAKVMASEPGTPPA
jgi:hypothetical protein